MRSIRLWIGSWVLILVAPSLWAQDKSTEDIRELRLRDWQPRSMMVAKESVREKPRFPVIDIHNHLGGGKKVLTPARVQRYLTEMDEAGVRMVVNLDGGWGEQLRETLDALDRAHPGRFATFALLNFDGIDDADWGLREAKRLEESFQTGAKGLKLHKTLGLRYRYKDGKLMTVDDPKLDAVWEMCAKHKKPVVIHVGDPAAFFTPLDKNNERWHELNANPHWLFHGDKFQPRQQILDQLERVIAKHPKTTFVNTHFGNNAEDLGAVARQLDKYPNMMVDFDARISELGRQPYSARRFFLKYQDRILFGTDTNPRRDAFRIYYRFLETDDEYFDCSASHHLQGFWRIYGIYLPAEVLEKIYYKNAERILALHQDAVASSSPRTMHVSRTTDFELTGDGSNAAWAKAAWEPLAARAQGANALESRFKMLYSSKGLYVLFDGKDEKLTAKFREDFQNLWTEDVFEVFLWTDERWPVYFEYEISPLGYELPIIIPNFDGKFRGWLPWHYEGARKTRKATTVVGGKKESGSDITGWRAEVFFPYAILEPLQNVPPQAGTRWRANFYRMDHDGGKARAWDWSRVGPSFHEFQKFGTLIFD